MEAPVSRGATQVADSKSAKREPFPFGRVESVAGLLSLGFHPSIRLRLLKRNGASDVQSHPH